MSQLKLHQFAWQWLKHKSLRPLKKLGRKTGRIRQLPVPPTASTPSEPTNTKAVGITMVKNEEDIIEQFVRHNLEFIDSLIVLENGSIDDTRRILLALQREGLPILILDDPITSYIQDQKMTRLLRAVTSSFFPDYVVPLDADEFIVCESRNAFLANLRNIPPGTVGLVPWQTYVVLPSYDKQTSEDIPRNFVSRRLQETPQYFKAIVCTGGRYANNIVFEMGNHNARTDKGKSLPSINLSAVKLAHYPVRDCQQVAAKGIITAMAQLQNNPNSEKEGLCYQHFTILKKIVSSNEITRSDLSDLSMNYAQSREKINWEADVVKDPITYNYARRYSARKRLSVLAKVAKSWEYSLLKNRSLGDELNDLVIKKQKEVVNLLQGAGNIRASTDFDPLWHYEHPFIDVAPFLFLADRHQFKSVLEAGCGLGTNLEIFKRKGADDVIGLDRFPSDYSLLSGHEYLQHDLSKPFDLGRKFDLVICTEVAEHLNSGCETKLIQSLARHANKLILFSAAEPNQPGLGHINCRPLANWLSDWQDEGWEPILFDSLAFRCASTLSWLRRNAIVLKPKSKGESDIDQSRIKLETISGLAYSCWAQNPGIRSFALQEQLPDEMYANASVRSIAPKIDAKTGQ
jgi:SAM-dependent methyltransferase